MIRLGKEKTLDNYFIDENGVITDLDGTVQELKLYRGTRLYFKGVAVHQIQMWTNFGYRDTRIWAIHHLDENKLNNALSNLIYLTTSEHMYLHNKGKHMTDESKQKISKNYIGFKGKKHSEEAKRKNSIAHLGNKNMYGKHHSEETKIKISISKGKKIINLKTQKIYNSIVEASHLLNIPYGRIYNQCKHKKIKDEIEWKFI